MARSIHLLLWRAARKKQRASAFERQRQPRWFETDFQFPPSLSEVISTVAALNGPGSNIQSSLPAKCSADAWEQFYQRHKQGKFFHPRSSLFASFGELRELVQLQLQSKTIQSLRIHEVGAGNGSSAAILAGIGGAVEVTASDISTTALSQCGAAAARGKRLHLCYLDLSKGPESLPRHLIGKFEAVLCTFVLSALPPARHAHAIASLLAMLAPGGMLCFRDYGILDVAMLRNQPAFSIESELAGMAGAGTPRADARLVRSFPRADGTLTHFFTLKELRTLVGQAAKRLGWRTGVDTRFLQGTAGSRPGLGAAADGLEQSEMPPGGNGRLHPQLLEENRPLGAHAETQADLCRVSVPRPEAPFCLVGPSGIRNNAPEGGGEGGKKAEGRAAVDSASASFPAAAGLGGAMDSESDDANGSTGMITPAHSGVPTGARSDRSSLLRHCWRYSCVECRNRKKGTVMRRVFLRAVVVRGRGSAAEASSGERSRGPVVADGLCAHISCRCGQCMWSIPCLEGK